MAKVKTSFFCQNCGAQSPKWVGKCNSCGEWNSFVEEIVERESPKTAAFLTGTGNQPKLYTKFHQNILNVLILSIRNLTAFWVAGLFPDRWC